MKIYLFTALVFLAPSFFCLLCGAIRLPVRGGESVQSIIQRGPDSMFGWHMEEGLSAIHTSTKVIVAFALIFLLVGCGVPDKQSILKDFKEVFSKEVGSAVGPSTVSVGPGEGDGENVYEHIEFDVTAKQGVEFQNGWLRGLSLKKGQILRGGEVVIFYQKKPSAGWVLTTYELRRVPK